MWGRVFDRRIFFQRALAQRRSGNRCRSVQVWRSPTWIGSIAGFMNEFKKFGVDLTSLFRSSRIFLLPAAKMSSQIALTSTRHIFPPRCTSPLYCPPNQPHLPRRSLREEEARRAETPNAHSFRGGQPWRIPPE